MIFVTDRNGLQTAGRLQRLSAEGLALLVDGQERRIPSSGVGRVEKRDSLWNGILMGAPPGALIGMAGYELLSPLWSRRTPCGAC
jgi:hypothetical protein